MRKISRKSGYKIICEFDDMGWHADQNLYLNGRVFYIQLFQPMHVHCCTQATWWKVQRSATVLTSSVHLVEGRSCPNNPTSIIITSIDPVLWTPSDWQFSFQQYGWLWCIYFTGDKTLLVKFVHVGPYGL